MTITHESIRAAVASLVLSAHNVGQAPMSGALLAKLGQHAHVVAHMLAAAPDVAAIGEGVHPDTVRVDFLQQPHFRHREFTNMDGVTSIIGTGFQAVGTSKWHAGLREAIDAARALAQQAAPAGGQQS